MLKDCDPITSGKLDDRPQRITTKETRVTMEPSSAMPMSRVELMNSLMSSAMRWSGLSAESPLSRMR